MNGKRIQSLLRLYPRNKNELFSRDELLLNYHRYVKNGEFNKNRQIEESLRLKPTRTISGVTPITVLTKPFPCPGKCIFCPNDIRMPKSYISSEPGAQRAARNAFDPYLQTYNRMLALKNIGHNVDKIELIVLGGTWSFYPLAYRIWFVKRCFEAINDFPELDRREEKGSLLKLEEIEDELVEYNKEVNIKEDPKETSTWEELEIEQLRNESAKCRNVGLVIETRPDFINKKEVVNIRRLGATKVQLGIQSLNDKILELNKRGTNREMIINAVKLLRSAGFKIHAHIMPNLYGADIKSDKKDYLDLFNLIAPDELKIYPTSVIKGTGLYELYKKGKHVPYSQIDLNNLIKFYLSNTPKYCRLTRIIRDIPSTDIAGGNRITNLRQTIESELIKEGTPCKCIRCREIRGKIISRDELKMNELIYEVGKSKEYFLSFDTLDDDKLAGFLRLNMSDKKDKRNDIFPELENSAIIREVHVYGSSVNISEKDLEKAQHIGLGKAFIKRAEEIAKGMGYKKISVISAIGTRAYYIALGYNKDGLYLSKSL